MNPTRLPALAALFSAALSTLSAVAQQSDAPEQEKNVPFQLSLWNSVQTSDPGDSIRGMRLNLPYGENRNVHGFDLGIANHATGNLYGAEFGFGGYVGGDVRGVQSHFILSIAKGELAGLQQGVYTSAGRLFGVQSGVVNHVRGHAYGARFAFVNLSDTYTEGAELGLVNYARQVHGLQLGIVNVADELHGVQIGLANLAKNGFLPFFPVVNAAL